MRTQKVRTKANKQWLFATQAAIVLDVDKTKVPEIARAGGIRMRMLPGESFFRFNAEDCQRVAHESVIDPRQAAGAAS